MEISLRNRLMNGEYRTRLRLSGPRITQGIMGFFSVTTSLGVQLRLHATELGLRFRAACFGWWLSGTCLAESSRSFGSSYQDCRRSRHSQGGDRSVAPTWFGPASSTTSGKHSNEKGRLGKVMGWFKQCVIAGLCWPLRWQVPVRSSVVPSTIPIPLLGPPDVAQW